jgi:LuxR family transcriptional regulator of csgAB operon
MIAKVDEESMDSQVLDITTIYLVGPWRVRNELLSSFLQEKIGAECLIVNTIRDLPALTGESGYSPRLVLLDCLGKDPVSLCEEFEAETKAIFSRDYVVLFNVSPGMGFEDKALMQGARGFFYVQDSIEQFERGILAIYAGELWVSRKIMTNYILEHRRPLLQFQWDGTGLTKRESEILGTITEGATNEEIAAKFFISTHTVKSHLYNIFKKVGVSNRMQAALWARRNL